MSIYPSDVLDLARKYIGYHEKASSKDLYSFTGNAGSGNYTMFQAELDAAHFWNNAKQSYEWCTSFVAWLFWRRLGTAEAKRVLCLTGDYGASCIMWARYYKAQGRLFSKPQVGDQFFKRDSDGDPCHTGLVESVSGNTFVCIEGNASNAVRRVTRRVSEAYGFGRPHYTAAVKPAVNSSTTAPTTKPTTKKEEDEEMTQGQFNQMANNWLNSLNAKDGSSAYAAEALKWAKDNGIMQGDESGRAMAFGLLTREQFAAMLKRFADKLHIALK